MPAIAERPPQEIVFSIPEALGEEGHLLFESAEEAVRHWEDRAERNGIGEELPEDDWDYNPVPLQIVGSFKARYHFVGPLKPMPYEWDE